MDPIPGIHQIIRLDKVDSTQKKARQLAEEGGPEWTLIVAKSQSAGKGRMDRKWSSAPGGLYFSLLLRPKIAPKRLAELSLATADAVGVRQMIDTARKLNPQLQVAVRTHSDEEAQWLTREGARAFAGEEELAQAMLRHVLGAMQVRPA